MEAICYNFDGHEASLEKLKNIKQIGDFEGYTRDSDILWTKAEISKNQALMFFLGGMELEIKNLVKMFEP